METSDFLPCGHTRQQGAWLGCTETECRAGDARISREFREASGVETPDPQYQLNLEEKGGK